MITHNVQPGSNEWIKLRAKYNTASEASAMLGISPHITRNELLRMKATCSEKEFSDFVQKNILDKGHEIERLARPLAEDFIKDDVFPVTGSEDNLLASFDGITLLGDIIWECKSANAGLIESVKNGIIPDMYHPQLQQQMMVSGCTDCLFTVSDGTEENTYHLWYDSNPDLEEKIIAGWKQFNSDLAEYNHVPEVVEQSPNAIMQLPALNINIKGEVLSTNLDEYKNTAIEFIGNINTELKTDSEFSSAENAVKFCKNAEQELEAAKKQALSQTADIDQLFKTVNFIQSELRSKRLYLDKLVKTKKVEVKSQIIFDAQKKISDHIISINKELGIVNLPEINHELQFVIKGKKLLSSIRNAVDTEVARVKIESDRIAAKIRINLAYLNDNSTEFMFLFSDLQNISASDAGHFTSIVCNRIRSHQEEEKSRIESERKRIREEEQLKAEAEQALIAKQEESIRLEKQRAEDAKQHEKLVAERAKIAEEERAKVEVEYEKIRIEKQKKLDEETALSLSIKEKEKHTNIFDVNVEVIDSLIAAGIGKTTANKVLKAIVDKKIKHVFIEY